MSYFSNYSFIKEDKNAKSLSFHFTKELAFINNDILNELKNIVTNEKKNARISLHTSAQNSLHDMIIAQGDYTYNRPHKHLNKAETYHILYGKQIVIIFTEEGIIEEKFIMSKDENMIYRFEKNTYHMTIPISKCCIFHETKIGPFIREGDSLFADWSPDVTNNEEIKSYLKKVK